MNRKSVVVPKRSLVQDGIVAYRAAGLPDHWQHNAVHGPSVFLVLRLGSLGGMMGSIGRAGHGFGARGRPDNLR